MKHLPQDFGAVTMTMRGVPLRLQASFFLLPISLIACGFLGDAGWGRGILSMILFLASLSVVAFLHELGHILLARRFGAPIRGIRLSGLGVFVTVERMPGIKPHEEALIALGGPAVSTLVSLALGAAGWLLLDLDRGARFYRLDLPAMVLLLAATNTLLTVFNLIPAFPMDGGQAVAALLRSRWSPARAERFVMTCGQTMAVAALPVVLFTTNDYLIQLAVVVTSGFILATNYRKRQALVVG